MCIIVRIACLVLHVYNVMPHDEFNVNCLNSFRSEEETGIHSLIASPREHCFSLMPFI